MYCFCDNFTIYIDLIVHITVLLRMASGDDLGFSFDTNAFLFLDSPETFSALTVYTSLSLVYFKIVIS